MSSDLIKAYELGKRLAFIKLSQKLEEERSSGTEVEELTKKLETLVQGSPSAGNNNDILDSSERSSPATWGDKMELETNSNTGINV
tara:strand:- start:224 stop:481 length:258 start_codon:yes stop_codon:yes gene_type:complete